MDQMNMAIGEDPPDKNPWNRFLWTPVQQGRIYRDWGGYLSYKEINKSAEKCYDNCLQINPRDATALYMRSICKRRYANTKSALEDALAAAEIQNLNPAISFAVCDALYELNEFESCKAELHENTRRYSSAVVKTFFNHLIVVDQNLNDCLGDSFGYFVLKNEKTLQLVDKKFKEGKIIDQRPRWKILREQNLCDVLSTSEIEETLLSPREIARRQRWLKVLNQLYFGRNWIDLNFLRSVYKEGGSQTSSLVTSNSILLEITETNYEIANKFVKMLHNRSPLYNEIRQKFKNAKLLKKYKTDYLNLVQYQTRRSMYKMLHTIKEYRKKGEVEKMSRYVESFMGDYVVLKTDRIMPWKYAFIYEVYNTLALAYADQYTFNEKLLANEGRLNLKKLFNLTSEVADRSMSITFGKRETYSSNLLNNNKDDKYCKLLARLEKRQIHAKYSIERCYLWHEIARTYFKIGRFDMCVSPARKAIDESKICKSTLWEFLSMMLIVKVYASMRKVEYCEKALEEAEYLARSLKDENLTHFIELASFFNEEEISLKKKSRSNESIRKRKSDSLSRTSSFIEKISSSTTDIPTITNQTIVYSTKEEQTML